MCNNFKCRILIKFIHLEYSFRVKWHINLGRLSFAHAEFAQLSFAHIEFAHIELAHIDFLHVVFLRTVEFAQNSNSHMI